MAFSPEYTPASRQPKKDKSGFYFTILMIILAVIGVITYLIFQSLQPKEIIPKPQPVKTEPKEAYTPPPPEPEPVVETKPELPAIVEEIPEPQPEPLHYIDYKVRKNDMLTLIAKKRYGTRYYWPLIYQKNERLLADQDGLKPGMHLEIPDTFDTTNPLHMEQLSLATIAAYKNYKARGKTDKARWILYGAHRYVNPEILSQYEHEIAPKDMAKVKEYIKRFQP